VEKMKKLGTLLLVVVLSVSAVSSASALTLEEIWEENFGPIFDGGVFVDEPEVDIPEEPGEIEKDWLESDERIFPEGYFNVTPKAKWTDKPANWFNVTSEGWNKKPSGYFDVDWGIKGVN
jgi:hypothetical protein